LPRSFGLARTLEPGVESIDMSGEQLALRWVCPSALRSSQVGRSTDVYAFGVTVWEMLQRCAPYDWIPSARDVVTQVLDGLRLPKPDVSGAKAPRVDTTPETVDALYAIMREAWADDIATRADFVRLSNMCKEATAAAKLETVAGPTADETSGMVKVLDDSAGTTPVSDQAYSALLVPREDQYDAMPTGGYGSLK
jgi:Protein tyrosine and serine/threonine kinase